MPMLPRMRPLNRLLYAALTLTLLYAPASAQKGRHNHPDKVEAELHINLIVAPVVFPPRHKDKDKDRDKDGDEASVTYNLRASAEKYSVTEETRTMLVDGGKHEQVQVTTVVMK